MLLTVDYKEKGVTAQSKVIDVALENEAKLSEVRAALTQKQMMLETDSFLRRGAQVVRDAERDIPLSALLDGDKIAIDRVAVSEPVKPPEPAGERSYTVQRTSDNEKRAQRAMASAKLPELRSKLADWLRSDDRFLDKLSGKIDPAKEDQWTVADIASAENLVKVAPAKEPVKPDVKLPTVNPSGLKPEWGLKEGQASEDLLKSIHTTLGTATAENPHAYTLLPIEQKQALFLNLYLDRGLRFPANPDGSDFLERSPHAPVVFSPLSSGPAAGQPPHASHWTTIATASRVLHEMRRRGVNVASASGSYHGFAVDSKFTHDLEQYSRIESTSIYLLDEMRVSKVTLSMDPQAELSASEGLTEAVKAILKGGGRGADKYRALHRDVFAHFGYFFATEVVAGGKWLRELTVQCSNEKQQSELLAQFTFAGGANHGPAKADVGYGNTTQEFSNHEAIRQLKQAQIISLGGSAGLAQSEGGLAQWVASVSLVLYWAVIENRKLVPVTRFLEPDLRQTCEGLISDYAASHIGAEYTVLDMKEYVKAGDAEFVNDLL